MINRGIFLQIVVADFLERARTYAYFMTLLVTIIVSFLFIPSNEANYGTVVISGYRGIYNSAWIGISMALSVNSFLSLVGFYLVKNTIDRDIQSKVGQIIGSSPLKKTVYMFGKFLSNLLLLLSIVLISFVMSMFMQWIRGEEKKIIIGDLLLSYLAFIIPVMFVVASLALLFEANNILRGKVGNGIYFLLWSLLLQYAFTIQIGPIQVSSLLSTEIIYNMITTDYNRLFPNSLLKVEDGIVSLDQPLNTFEWKGVNWNIGLIASRVPWLVLSMFFVIFASRVFKGFDEVKVTSKSLWKRRKKEVSPVNSWNSLTELRAISPIQIKYSFFHHLHTELILLLKGLPIWWYMIACIIILASILAPVSVSREYLSVISWLWPLFIWSSMGVREVRYYTSNFIFSSPFPVGRQIILTWLAGVFIAVVAGIGYAIKLVIIGDIRGLFAWFIGSLYIPSLAFSLGIWTKTNKSFELIYLSIVFVGIFNNLRAFDFLGIMEGTAKSIIPIVYLFITVILLISTFYGRYLQTKS